jgi:hypothetical protein
MVLTLTQDGADLITKRVPIIDGQSMLNQHFPT